MLLRLNIIYDNARVRAQYDMRKLALTLCNVTLERLRGGLHRTRTMHRELSGLNVFTARR